MLGTRRPSQLNVSTTNDVIGDFIARNKTPSDAMNATRIANSCRHLVGAEGGAENIGTNIPYARLVSDSYDVFLGVICVICLKVNIITLRYWGTLSLMWKVITACGC